ncbi:MAG TPA: CD225/dispanin family protein [Firmicutes bacterium]|jgi:hypothetical protein|nr:CD225/dispanin family protein [Bacillota bacterium]
MLNENDQFCSKCGRKRNDFSGTAYSQYNEDDYFCEVPDHLASAILVTIFCCLPFGIPAIVYAAMANSAKGAGKYREASENAKAAGNWVKASFITGLVAVFLYVLLNIGG